VQISPIVTTVHQDFAVSPDVTAPMPAAQVAAATAAMGKVPTSPEAWSVDDMLAATEEKKASFPPVPEAVVASEVTAPLHQDTIREVNSDVVAEAIKVPSAPPPPAYTPPPAPAPAKIEQPLAAAAPSAPGVVVTTQPPPAKKKGGGGWLVFLVLFLLALGGGGFWAFKMGYLNQFIH